MPQHQEIKEMKDMLTTLISLNQNIIKNQYRILSLHKLPKKRVRVPYDFYLN